RPLAVPGPCVPGPSRRGRRPTTHAPRGSQRNRCHRPPGPSIVACQKLDKFNRNVPRRTGVLERPAADMRWVWLWRGVGIGALLLPLGWLPLLPLGYVLWLAGIPSQVVAYVVGAVLLACAAVAFLFVYIELRW